MKLAALLSLVVAVGVVGGVAVGVVVIDDERDDAVVVRVIDGDTLSVDLDGTQTKVRLLNVDTPETKHPDRPDGCLGPEATSYLKQKLPPRTRVELEYDGERLDRYGRTLAGVWLGRELVNAEVARAGLGVPVQFNGQTKFLPAVEKAAEEGRRRKNGAYADDVSCALPSAPARTPRVLRG